MGFKEKRQDKKFSTITKKCLKETVREEKINT